MCTRVCGNAGAYPLFAGGQRFGASGRGFTLIELMITLAVAAILAMIAVPSFQHLIASSHLSGLNNALADDLQFARTQAVSRQVDVAVAASAGSWENGWKVEISPAGAAAGVAPDVLRRHAGVASTYAVNAGNVHTITYKPQGSLDLPGSPGTAPCFVIYARNGEHNAPRFLELLPAGGLQQASGSPKPQGCPDPP